MIIRLYFCFKTILSIHVDEIKSARYNQNGNEDKNDLLLYTN